MKSGFTTGSCAAAAAKAAIITMIERKCPQDISIMTPGGQLFKTDVLEISGGEDNGAVCAVRKPENLDPDVTAGMLICASAVVVPNGRGCVYIEGGKGIGKVTLPGLDRPPGDAAINTVPRKMIEYEALSVMEEYEIKDSVRIVISAPDGEAIAQKTFNPKLGIEGGISIIGTTGIVEPMSTKAVIDTIRVSLNQKKALGSSVALVSPGNYGLEFLSTRYGISPESTVKCSNYIGDTIDIAKSLGFSGMLLVGHAGKLVKLSGGIMNTHSHEADCRMELMAAAAIRANADIKTVNAILDCKTTDEVAAILFENRIDKPCFSYITDRIDRYLRERADGMRIGCIWFSNRYGILGMTEEAEVLIREVT